MRTRQVGRALVLAVAILVVAGTGAVAGVPAGGDHAAVETDAVGDSALSVATSSPVQAGDAGVSSVTIDQTPVEAGETTTVRALVENDADGPVETDLTLTVDGETVEERSVEIGRAFDIVEFELSLDEPGTYTVAVDGVEADRELTVNEREETEEEDEQQEDGVLTVDSDDITIESVGIDPSNATVGETVFVTANLTNAGAEEVDVELELEVDGEVVETAVAEAILPEAEFPGVVTPYSFEYEPDETGTYTVSVSGTEAETELVVEEADEPEETEDSGFFSFLGFLPLGILRLVALFVVLPIAVIYLALKALAIYLGY